MKYLEIVMALLMINLTVGFFAQTNLMHNSNTNQIKTSSPVDADGNLLEEESLAYKVYTFQEDRNYLNNAQNLDQQYLQSGGDFVKGLSWFLTFVKSTTLINITLRNFGVPNAIIWYFAIPIYFLYMLAMIQFVSGRSFGGND